jgi:Tfp pilus assembly protein PilO
MSGEGKLMDINFDKFKNFKLEDLKTYLESYKELFKDKTFVTKVAIGLVIFFINFTIYSVWLSPKLAEQSLRIKTMDDYKKKTVQYNANFSNLQNELNSFKNVTNSVNLFFSKKESEELYQNLSTYATSNGLNITNLVKGNAQKVNVSGAPTVGKDGKPAAPGGQYYYKIPVTFQIKGSYIGYLKFRLALSRSNKFVNFDNEKITVNQGDKTNSVTADVAISIVGLPDEFN